MHKNIRAFTLVELIVVVTIIAILWTVGFISYSNYLTTARDSNRISQMTRIADALQVYGTTNNLPLPENKIDITVWWTAVWFQGDLWESVLQTIDYSSTARDPSDNTPFVYYLGTDRRNFQLMAFMEEQKALTSFLPQSMANFENRFPKSYGRRMWILLQDTTNNPIHRVADATPELNTLTWFTAYLNDNDVITWASAWDLLSASPIASCKRRREAFWWSANGIYTINPDGTEIQVYCEMNEQGGGWTLAARSTAGGTWTFTSGTWLWNLNSTEDAYNLDASAIDFAQVMLASYQNQRNIIEYKTLDSTTVVYSVDGSTLWQWGITGWDYDWNQGMIFVR